MLTGRKASFSSAPATRSLETSTGLMTLMPPWMKVLSPQLTTWRPNADRGLVHRLAIAKSWNTNASSSANCVADAGPWQRRRGRRDRCFRSRRSTGGADERTPVRASCRLSSLVRLTALEIRSPLVVVEVAVIAVDRETAARGTARPGHRGNGPAPRPNDLHRWSGRTAPCRSGHRGSSARSRAP
jgi:hypothetical protein